MIPVKFGIAFTAVHLNQSGALVTVYTDGSVLLTHGGTEMGQGLHTKMVQVAATTLGIPAAKVHVMETSTDKVGPAVHTLSILVLQKVPSEANPKVRNHGEGPY